MDIRGMAKLANRLGVPTDGKPTFNISKKEKERRREKNRQAKKARRRNR